MLQRQAFAPRESPIYPRLIAPMSEPITPATPASGSCSSPNRPYVSAPTLTSAPSGRKRFINSCSTCRRRKVRCDREKPMCARCTISGYPCAYTDSDVPIVPPPVGSPRRHGSIDIYSPSSTAVSAGRRFPDTSERPAQELLQRLQRLEEIVAAIDPGGSTSHSRYSPPIGPNSSGVATASTDGSPATTVSPAGRLDVPNFVTTGLGAGKLLNDGGRVRYVSSLYWELITDEVCQSRNYLLCFSRYSKPPNEPRCKTLAHRSTSSIPTPQGLSDHHMPAVRMNTPPPPHSTDVRELNHEAVSTQMLPL